MPTLLCLLAAAGLGSSCGRTAPDERAAAGADEAVTDSSAIPVGTATEGGEASGPGPVPGDSGTRAAPRTGLENFEVPDDSERAAVADTVALEIENGSGATVVVSARAGADPVVLDTVAGGAWLRIDLVGPPGSLEIVWETLEGSRSGTVPVPAGADSLVQLSVGRPGGT